MALEQGRVMTDSGTVLFARAVKPRGFFSRARGLIGRPALQVDEAWWFERCSAVHSFGMRRPIDVVHLNEQGRVLHICSSLRPCSMSWIPRSRQVVELAAGTAAACELSPGQILRFKK